MAYKLFDRAGLAPSENEIGIGNFSREVKLGDMIAYMKYIIYKYAPDRIREISTLVDIAEYDQTRY